MVFDKAKWWANRIYAGYSGWRLPTVDEALTLLQMDRALYAGLADFAVWTGDAVSDQVALGLGAETAARPVSSRKIIVKSVMSGPCARPASKRGLQANFKHAPEGDA